MNKADLQLTRRIVFDAYCEGDTEAEALLDVIDRALAAPEQEPVAWATFDGEGSYDLRLYECNENYRDDYLKRNGDKYAGWVEPLYRHPAPQSAQPVSLETVYETIIAWDIAGKRSRRELARRMLDLFAAPPSRKWQGLTDEERLSLIDSIHNLKGEQK